jgi:hypothetical protein
MSSYGNGSSPVHEFDCAGLITLSQPEVEARLGRPGKRRVVGGDTWLMFESPEMQFRIRCSSAGHAAMPTVASWTATFRTGHASLAEAARSVGLWPAAAPDVLAREVTAPLVRRALPCPVRRRVYSLTAGIRQGLFTTVSVFDEEPDWL